jgi:hypothetical protein
MLMYHLCMGFIFINEQCFHNSREQLGLCWGWVQRSSCKVSKNWIYLVPCLYIYVLMLFVVKNPKIYQTNTSVHGRNTRQQNKLYVPSVRSSTIQRGVYYSSVKIFNHLLQNISKLHNNIHIFKTMLKNYLVKNAFYSINEFISKDCNS